MENHAGRLEDEGRGLDEDSQLLRANPFEKEILKGHTLSSWRVRGYDIVKFRMPYNGLPESEKHKRIEDTAPTISLDQYAAEQRSKQNYRLAA